MASTAPAAKKRKLAEPKFYAVRAGHTAGVYTEWEQCKEQITGFKGASFKSFPTHADAQGFVEGRDVAPPASEGQAERFYAVAVGLVPGIYTDWPTAQRQIAGVKGPKYKKFATKAEAADFVKAHSNGGVSQSVKSEDAINIIRPISYEPSASREPPQKSRRTDTGDTSNSTRAATNVFQSKAGPSKTSALKVYTDGSALGNGKSGASAGVGVFFGVGDPRNISEPLKGPRQTNQRAELTGILRALENVAANQGMQIITDSQYSINCVTKWHVSWEKNGWRNAKKESVENQDLIKDILIKIRERQRMGTSTDFIWIKGHSEDPGNEAADRLAVAGSQRAR